MDKAAPAQKTAVNQIRVFINKNLKRNTVRQQAIGRWIERYSIRTEVDGG
jgi:hypothetical protein